MSPIQGTVEDGSVRVLKKGILRNGQRVIVVPIPSTEAPVLQSPEAEQEDIEFVRAGRDRRAGRMTE